MSLQLTYPYPEYPYRTNQDGTYESICSTCYRTIGWAHSKEELLRAEQQHMKECPGPPKPLFRRSR